jgi:hypothetical protein
VPARRKNEGKGGFLPNLFDIAANAPSHMKLAPMTVLLLLMACGQMQEGGQQSNLTKPIEEITDNELGFGCGFAGMPTRAVQLFTSLVLQGDYESIRCQLYSESPAYRFMAVKLCTYYAEKGRMLLTEEDRTAIRESFTSKEKITVCSGCDYRSSESLGRLLKGERQDMIRSNFQFWLKGMHPED